MISQQQQAQIQILTQIILKDDDTPNYRAIGRKMGLDGETVSRHHRNPVSFPTTDETEAQVNAVNDEIRQLFGTVKQIVYPDMLRSFIGMNERAAAVAEDPDYDARDTAHIMRAQGDNLRTISLISGDVTSRSQQHQVISGEQVHRIIEVPRKGGAFEHVTGDKMSIQDAEYDEPAQLAVGQEPMGVTSSDDVGEEPVPVGGQEDIQVEQPAGRSAQVEQVSESTPIERQALTDVTSSDTLTGETTTPGDD